VMGIFAGVATVAVVSLSEGASASANESGASQSSRIGDDKKPAAKHCCAGKNKCAGQGGCGATKGKNTCAGKGGCSTKTSCKAQVCVDGDGGA